MDWAPNPAQNGSRRPSTSKSLQNTPALWMYWRTCGASRILRWMLTSQEALRNAVKAAINNITRMAQMRLPPGVYLSAGNCGHMDSPKSTAVRGHCADFMRFHLVKACDPVEAILHYSHRVSGRGSKREELKDVSENIVETLIDCLLDSPWVNPNNTWKLRS
ncbi:hypothetical protein ANCCAN_22663 [Ancylostoma caninum]|uniref:Uncharacterized protein n=1 Tax=Ancylostoma caninum TaxID=29170 RepID=A0A368FH37_ANCCA|nr:hypothetical protein ANCCAN_22663 [Ancylostoma caninum]